MKRLGSGVHVFELAFEHMEDICISGFEAVSVTTVRHFCPIYYFQWQRAWLQVFGHTLLTFVGMDYVQHMHHIYIQSHTSYGNIMRYAIRNSSYYYNRSVLHLLVQFNSFDNSSFYPYKSI